MEPLLSIAVILIGVYGLIANETIIKSVFSATMIESGVILLFLNLGALNGGVIPISDGVNLVIVDPIPQALMITTIVIGSTVTSLALILSIKVFHNNGSIHWKDMTK
ncbi:MAG: cation:proton antiporter subunit C [Firmicutes bacterium]|nr:cation:proton antiporter subunit C [Bacillota bacterium]